MDIMEFVYFLIFAVLIFIKYLIAEWFYEAAEAKGYHDTKYFWICFLLDLPGWLLVIALPDRGNAPQTISDELPDI